MKKINIKHTFGSIVVLFILFSISSTAMAVVGGVADGFVSWPDNAEYFNMDQVVRIDHAPKRDSGQGWYWAYQFQLGKTTGYMGLQQQPDGKRTAHFALWDNFSAHAAPGFNASAFGGEGTGTKIFGDYPWVEGHSYRLRVWSQPKNYWGCWIKDIDTGVETYLGEIQNQNDPGKQLNSSVSFTELYSGANNCNQAEPVRSSWSMPTANGGDIEAASMHRAIDPHSGCGPEFLQ